MPPSAIHARPPNGASRSLAIVRDPDDLAGHLEDAAHFPGGHATELVAPSSEADVALAIQTAAAVLPIGAQSSLTGGATPMGERLISLRRFNRILDISAESVRVQAGVSLTELQTTLTANGRYYPPAPTYAGAFVGGTVATNAAGAATFKYGTTRQWVQALTIVLPTGDVLDVERGAVAASTDGGFALNLSTGAVRVPVPTYNMPQTPKLSAGYYAARGMDLVDLFVGSEGTLGVITEVTLKVLPARPAPCLVLLPFDARKDALAFTRMLRAAARETWNSRDPNGVDVAGVEFIDRRSIELLREDGADIRTGVELPPTAQAALLVMLELPPGTRADDAFDEIGRVSDAERPDRPLLRFWDLLTRAGVRAEDVAIALPGEQARMEQLLALREAVPAAVNRRVGIAKREIHRSIEKTAADMIVPFDHLEQLLNCYDAEFGKRRLDIAVWGHVSDGNVHLNVVPRSIDDVAAGQAAILASGREAMRLGGAPLAEHGVGRNPVKQALLQLLYGERGVEEMRQVKRAIDPDWKMAPGVLFPARTP